LMNPWRDIRTMVERAGGAAGARLS
jgi:hypothetical protein